MTSSQLFRPAWPQVPDGDVLPIYLRGSSDAPLIDWVGCAHVQSVPHPASDAQHHLQFQAAETRLLLYGVLK